ncbi:MAG: metallophosphoesterase [Bacteroidales bacterium]|nr:MAG: metallophosphoesterase [Bacteroidales bacterium]
MRRYLLFPFLYIIIHSFLFYSLSQTAINFSGNDSYISIDDSPEIRLSEFSIECWFMRKDTGVSVMTGTDSIYAVPIVARGIEEDPDEANMNYFLGIRREDSILIAAFEESNTSDNPGKNHHLAGFTTIHNDMWYHAAVTYDGVYLKLYLNGILESALEIEKQPMNQSNIKTVIGGVILTGDILAGYFNGLVDETRIWNYARTQEEIRNEINNEIKTPLAGLVIRLGLNEGSGTVISYTGMPGLNPEINGSTWNWASGTHFENINPPVCNEFPLLKIGLIADPQYCDCPPGGTRYFRETLWKLPAAIDTLNKNEVDFVVTLGDVIDRYYESFDSILPLYDSLDMPEYKLLGNHAFEEVHDSLKDTIIHLYNMPDYYYHFTYNDWRFIILDGTELAAYDSILHPDLREEADSVWQSVQGQINDETWNGGIGRKQRQWIETTISDALVNNQKVILFCHFPVYPQHYLNLWNREDIIEIVEKYDNTVAYINGHNHDGNYGILNGKHYITQKAMVETIDTSSYSILEIYDNKLVFKSYGLMDNHILTYKNNNRKPYDITLLNDVLTFDIDSGDFAGKFSVEDSTGPGNYSYGLTDKYSFTDNSLFDISNDSLYLATSEDLSQLETYFIKVSAMNCCLDTITKVIAISFDTNAVWLNKSIPDTLLVLGQANLNINLDSVFTDRSENGLVYNANSGNSGKASVTVIDRSLIVQQISGGESVIAINAFDSYTGQSSADTFTVTVFDPLNHIPEVTGTIDDQVVHLNYDTLVINLDTVFFDQNGDTLIYELEFENDTTVGFYLTDSILEIFPLMAGENNLEITAGDDRGGYAELSFIITVNTVPELAGSIPDLFFQMGDASVIFNLDTVFIDKDSDTLYYEFVTGDTAIVSVLINGNILEIEPLLNGYSAIDLYVYDGKGGSAGFRFNMAVNASPQVYFEIPDLSFIIYDPPLYINLDTVFVDPDGDALHYTTETGNPGILDLVITDSELMLAPVMEGSTNVEIHADDSRGGVSVDDFDVSVDDISAMLYRQQGKSNVLNYPNPFSRESKILYHLSENCHVRLSIYSQYGQLIKVLVSEVQDAGNKEVLISGADFSPGIYYCKLQTGDRQVHLTRMVVVK